MTPETKELATIQTVGEVSKFEYLQRLGKLLAASGYFKDASDQAKACVKIIAGDELGIPPVASMMGISIVQGRVQLGGNLIASRIRTNGYDYHVAHLDGQKCVIEFRSRPDSSGKRTCLGESSFSIEDARQAGLATKDNYKQYPRNMLFNRAISNGAKWFTPDVFAGIPVYAEGELSDAPEIQSEPPEVIEHKAEPEPPKPPMINPPSFAEKLAVYTREKERVGEKSYYAVLARHGFEHANEVVKRPLMERQEIYQELKALPDAGDAQEPEVGA